MPRFLIDNTNLQRIWDAHHLGKIESVDWTSRGMNNPALIINQRYVIRFDGLEHTGRSRFFGEQTAYEKLRAQGIPAPEVIVLDVSKTLAEKDYLIMTRIAGRPMIDDWPSLSPTQRERVGCEAGRYLAMMHEITLKGYGQLLLPENERFPNWYAYVMDYLREYGEEGITRGVFGAEVRDRIWTVFEKHRAFLENVTPARLVHWDYHAENLMQQDGHVTGILDFEWALCGDAIYDFKLRDYWDETCPGSREPIFKGYTEIRTLPDDLDLRIGLYQAMMFLDQAVDGRDEAAQTRGTRQLLAALDAVENI